MKHSAYAALTLLAAILLWPGSELLARCWQHEYDHLDGRLILDYMSEADKIANRRPLKQLESLYRPGKTAS